jgi:hypothetical protein
MNQFPSVGSIQAPDQELLGRHVFERGVHDRNLHDDARD